jgi:hypothetical protein
LYLVRGTDGFDESSLRQGDILAGVPFPLLEHGRMHVLGAIAQEYDYAALPTISAKTHEHRSDKGWVTLQVPARFGLCMVTSNCCDLEPRDGHVQAYAVTLARLRPISDDIRNDAARFASLTANKDPRDTQNAGYIDFFYLEPHALLEGKDWNLHFNQVVTLPTSDINLLLRKKVIQLDDRTRAKFKIKLAFSSGRFNDDELNAGLDEPWQEAAPAQPATAQPEPPAAGEHAPQQTPP